MNSSFLSAVPPLARLLYTQNPFYLVGTLLVLFGLQQALGREPTLATSGLLVMTLGGYTLLLAAVAALVIRVGQVWDDARTILLVIVLLFFMLSTSLDFHLLFTLEEPWPGTWLLAGALAFSVLLSEALLRGLSIRLAAAYRLPYYFVLLLLFGWPVLLGWMNYHSYYDSLAWALFGFPAVGAFVLLTLLPAARTPLGREPKSGTPWPWPFYPWSLFVYLTIGLAIRSWWLTIAFEPAKGPDAYFRPYFLFPLALAWSALLLEMGLARSSRRAIAAGLLLPLVGLVIGFPGPPQGRVETEFLSRLVAALGSPPQLIVGGLLGIYGWAWLRRIRGSEGMLLLSALLAAVVGPQTLDWSSLTQPRPLVLAALGGTLLVQSALRESSWRAIAGGGLVAVAAQSAGPGIGVEAGFWLWHAPLVWLLAVAAIFNDALARGLRALSWRAAPVLGLAGAAVYPWAMPNLPGGTLDSFLGLLFAAAVALWIRQRGVAPLAAAMATLGACLASQMRQCYLLLAHTSLADGLPWLASGLAIVVVALSISLFKMGLWPRARDWLTSIDLLLGKE